MNIKKAIFSLAFIVSLVLGSSAQAATTTDSRYFVKSTSQFWKKSLQIRNVFDSGFTADLTDFQLRLAKMFGVETVAVKKLNILAAPVKKTFIKTPVNQVGWGVEAIYGETLDETLPSGGKDVTVAVLDTGASINHPDLKGRVVLCSDFTGIDSFIRNSCEDKNGHGTQVAGVIAATGGVDGKGIYGIAPEASLLILKTCAADGTCFADDVASAIRHAVDNKANIILLPLGSDNVSSLINDAISYAAEHDILVIAAAGNDGPYTGSLDYPATNEYVISVGAVDANLTVPSWSARGANTASASHEKTAGDLEFVAPGVNIESTSNDNDYVTLSGTSMAAAHIAGLAAKAWQADEKDAAKSTRELLHTLADSIAPVGNTSSSGWGMPSL